MKKNKKLSTFEQEMQNVEFKQAFEQEYREFALQELLAAMAEGHTKSVRALAKSAGLHPNAIQNLRSGKTTDIKMTTFLKIVMAYGYTLELVKGEKHIPVKFDAGESNYAMAG
jgi:DNA-binding Xre family transcriptional regulator